MPDLIGKKSFKNFYWAPLPFIYNKIVCSITNLITISFNHLLPSQPTHVQTALWERIQVAEHQSWGHFLADPVVIRRSRTARKDSPSVWQQKAEVMVGFEPRVQVTQSLSNLRPKTQSNVSAAIAAGFLWATSALRPLRKKIFCILELLKTFVRIG